MFREVKRQHPFTTEAIVVLPDHLHCIWTLPSDDANYSLRWRQIKANFSRQIIQSACTTVSQRSRGERGLWQRRFWEHTICDQQDFNHHMDYIHWNPVKHGLVTRAQDWPYSSIHRYIRRGDLPDNWSWQPRPAGP